MAMKNWSWKGTLREWANSLKLVEPFLTIDDLHKSSFLLQVLRLIAKKRVEEQDENLDIFGRLKAHLRGFYQPMEWIDYEQAKRGNHTEILKLLTVLIAYSSLKVDEPIFKKNPGRFITSIEAQRSLTKFLTLVIENGNIVPAEHILFEEDDPQNFNKTFTSTNPPIVPRVLFVRNSSACETFTNSPNSANSSFNTPRNSSSKKSELLSARNHQVSALERKLFAKEELYMEIFGENEGLKDRIKELESQIDKIRGEKERTENSLKLLKELNAELNESNGHFENKLQEAAKEKEEIKVEFKKSQSSVEKYRESKERLDGQRILLENELLTMQKEKSVLCKAIEEMEMRLKKCQDELLELVNQNKSLNSEREEFQKQIINLGEQISVIKNECEAQKLRYESNLIAIEDEKSNISKSLASAELDRDEKVKETRNYYLNEIESIKSQFLEESSSTKAEFNAIIQAKDKEIYDLKAQALNASNLQSQVESKLLEAVKEKEEIKEKLRVSESSVEKYREKNGKLDDQLLILRIQMQKIQEEKMELCKSLKEMEMSLKASQGELLEFESENKNLISEKEEFLKQIGNLESKLLEEVKEKEEIKDELKISESSVEKYRESNEKLDDQLLILGIQMQKIQEEKMELCKSLKEMEMSLKASQGELLEFESENKNLNSEKEEFLKQIGNLESKLLEEVKEKEEIKDELKISESSVEKYRESNEKLDDQLLILGIQMQKIQEEKMELCKSLKEMEMSLKASQGELLEFESENKSLSSEKEEFQKQIINLGDQISIIREEFEAQKLSYESKLIAIEEEFKKSQSSVEKYRETTERLDDQQLLLENEMKTMLEEKIKLFKSHQEMEGKLKTRQDEVLELVRENKTLNSEKEEFQMQIINLGYEISVIRNDFEAQKLRYESNLIAIEEEKANLSKSLAKLESFQSQFLEEAASTKNEFNAIIQAKDKEISDLMTQAVSISTLQEQVENLKREKAQILEIQMQKILKEKIELCKSLKEMEMRLKRSQDEILELVSENKTLNSEKEAFQKQLIKLGTEISVIRDEFEAQKLRYESNLIAIEEEKANLSKSLASVEFDKDEKVKETRNYYSNKFESFKSQFLEVASSTKAEFQAQIQVKDKEICNLKAQALNATTLQDQVENLKREKAQIRSENIELHSKVYQLEAAKHKESLQMKGLSKQKSTTIPSSLYWNQIESETSDSFINPRRLSSASITSNLSTCSGRSKVVPLGSGSLFTCADEDGINIESKDVTSEFGNVEEFSAKNRAVLKAGSGFVQPEENSKDRLEELQRRNTLMQPHLRSCYPTEYMFIQPNTKLDEKEMRMTMGKSVSGPLKKSEAFSIPFERQSGSHSQLPSRSNSSTLISTCKPKTQPTPGPASSAHTSSNSTIRGGNEPINKGTPTPSPRPDSTKPSKRKSIFGIF